VADYAQTVARCKLRIEGMRKLILDLLDMTHIESGRKDRDLKQVDVREIAEMAIEGRLPKAEHRGITMALHADDPVTMIADRSELEMILSNLISNAVKYNRDGGRVDVTLERHDDRVRIVVADTGIGMTREEADKLFGEFVRIRNAKTSGILGSGLGLSIVRKLAQLYDGETTVESQPDVGSTFTVVLKSASETDHAPVTKTVP
jgi:signal transduction histidine kinase